MRNLTLKLRTSSNFKFLECVPTTRTRTTRTITLVTFKLVNRDARGENNTNLENAFRRTRSIDEVSNSEVADGNIPTAPHLLVFTS